MWQEEARARATHARLRSCVAHGRRIWIEVLGHEVCLCISLFIMRSTKVRLSEEAVGAAAPQRRAAACHLTCNAYIQHAGCVLRSPMTVFPCFQMSTL